MAQSASSHSVAAMAPAARSRPLADRVRAETTRRPGPATTRGGRGW